MPLPQPFRRPDSEHEMTSTTFALIPPAILVTVACMLLAVSRCPLPAASRWSLGFALCSLGLLISAMPGSPVSAMPGSPQIAELISDFLMIGGFFFHAEAYLLHFGKPPHVRKRLVLLFSFLAIDTSLVLWPGNLQSGRLIGDIAIACMLGFALVRVMDHARSFADRMLVLAGSIVVIGALIRVQFHVAASDPGIGLENHGLSAQAVAMEIATVAIGAIFVLSIAAALADRVFGRLRDAAERDPLTGLLNRRGLERAVAATVAESPVRGAVIIGDIDPLQAIDDGFGDTIVCGFAEELNASFGPGSICARLAGGEFACFVPDTVLGEAGAAAQSVRLRFAARDWRDFGIDRQITASFGVVVIAASETGIDRAIVRASACLRAARHAGCNQVVLEGGMFELKSPAEPELPSNVIPLRRRTASGNAARLSQVSG